MNATTTGTGIPTVEELRESLKILVESTGKTELELITTLQGEVARAQHSKLADTEANETFLDMLCERKSEILFG